MTEGGVTRRGRALEMLLVGALPTLLTLGRFRNGFVFDDVFVIVRGEFIHAPARFMLHHPVLQRAQVATLNTHPLHRRRRN